MTTFVLVHGAFRGGWAWRYVRPHLIAAGHDVYAPSLLGAGELAGSIADVDGLDVWTNQIVALIELEDLSDVTLVGHSQGGLVTRAVAARIPARIGAVVHLDAALPLSGQRAVDLTPGGAPDVLPARSAVIAPIPASPQGEHGAVGAAWLNARSCPSPVSVALDPVPALPEGLVEHRIFCSETPEFYPSSAVRARFDADETTYRLIQAGHDAPLSAPTLVADLLLELLNHPHESPERNH